MYFRIPLARLNVIICPNHTSHTITTKTKKAVKTANISKAMPAKKRSRSTSSDETTECAQRPRLLSPPIDWPAPKISIEAVRSFILDCVHSPSPVLLVPDKDADGLCSGSILRQTLISLGKPKEKIGVHFVKKGGNVHQFNERDTMEDLEVEGTKCGYVIVLDQGSRGGDGIVRTEEVEVKADDGKVIKMKRRVAIIDHHYSLQFPDDAVVRNLLKSRDICF